MTDRIRRALVSVFDKEGIVPFCRALDSADVRILSSGGTAKLLKEHGIPVTEVAEYTGFPEMLDGRVKTLHPKIHAGILAIRSNPEHVAQLRNAEIDPIDLVVVNLYPFARTAADPKAAFDDVVEMIDVGGPTMVRAAAKNHADVTVVVDPSDYDEIAGHLRAGVAVPGEARARLAAKAFAHTSAYDSDVARYLTRSAVSAGEDAAAGLPDRLALDLPKLADLRYGENPHQRAAFYGDPTYQGASIACARQLQGKELSFNNILDLDAALALVADLPAAGCVIVKHGNPCGAALGSDPDAVFRRALDCDPVSAFGGVIAFNRPVNGAAARAIAEAFYEAVIAPTFDGEARATLATKKNLRVLEAQGAAPLTPTGWDLRRVRGGLLAQDWDTAGEAVRQARVATRRAPTDDEWAALEFAWTVCRHVKSNAIVYAFADRTAGIGAGQMSRVDSARFGIEKSRVPLKGAAMASDAFFPFRDGLDVAAEAGITAVVQPGGSVRDEEVIAAADERGLTMVLTARRHFRH